MVRLGWCGQEWWRGAARSSSGVAGSVDVLLLLLACCCCSSKLRGGVGWALQGAGAERTRAPMCDVAEFGVSQSGRVAGSEGAPGPRAGRGCRVCGHWRTVMGVWEADDRVHAPAALALAPARGPQPTAIDPTRRVRAPPAIRARRVEPWRDGGAVDWGRGRPDCSTGTRGFGSSLHPFIVGLGDACELRLPVQTRSTERQGSIERSRGPTI